MSSTSKEDYLKYIYKMQSSERKVTTTALAKVLEVSPASVSEMVSKLSKQGLIINNPYHGFGLTKNGEQIAVNLLRKHRLIEVFLNDILNYPWDEVHPEAERIEHSVSDLFVDKLEKYLGYPKLDPHGDPIPDRNGKLSRTNDINLNDAQTGKNYVITKVPDGSKEILRYLTGIGIELKSKIFINQRFIIDNSVLITFKNRTHLLSRYFSEKIFVEAVR